MRVVIHPEIWKWLKPLYDKWLEGEMDKMSKVYKEEGGEDDERSNEV